MMMMMVIVVVMLQATVLFSLRTAITTKLFPDKPRSSYSVVSSHPSLYLSGCGREGKAAPLRVVFRAHHHSTTGHGLGEIAASVLTLSARKYTAARWDS